jgi:acyl carrier protein
MLGQTVTPYEDLRAKGLDSVGFLEVVIFIEKELRIPFPLQLMSGSPITTVEAITEHLTASHPMIHGTR